MKQFKINKNTAVKLIKFIQKTARNMPESEIYKSLRKKRIKVNGIHITDSKYQLQIDDLVELYINDDFFAPVKNSHVWEKTCDDINIIYEDHNILIANKPQGLLCHEDDFENVHTLLNKAKKHTNSEDISLCHRLDRNTKGLVVLAKNALALREMTVIIRKRLIKKFYICEIENDNIADNVWHTKTAYLTRDLEKKRVYVHNFSKGNAKEIITKFRKIASNTLEIELVTGRTHQIRAHLAFLGYPLKGDAKYGNAKGKSRQHLTASRIEFLKIPSDFALNYLSNKIFKI